MRLYPRAFWVLLLLVPILTAAAAGPDPAVKTPAPRGVLWKIERTGETPSFLFGTIHLADKRVTDLPAPVNKAFETSSVLVSELVVDASTLVDLLGAMFFDDARTLETAVGRDLYAKVTAAFSARGLPTTGLIKYKPWAAAMVLSMPAQTGEPPLDMQLQQRAAKDKKKVEGLETTQEQIAVFDELPIAEQRAFLESVLREQLTLDKQVEAFVQAYLDRDIALIRGMYEAQEAGNAALRDNLQQRLLIDRNRRMVERLRARLKQGNLFIAVGVAHLPGRDGIIDLLEREGYRVSAIY